MAKFTCMQTILFMKYENMMLLSPTDGYLRAEQDDI